MQDFCFSMATELGQQSSLIKLCWRQESVKALFDGQQCGDYHAGEMRLDEISW